MFFRNRNLITMTSVASFAHTLIRAFSSCLVNRRSGVLFWPLWRQSVSEWIPKENRKDMYAAQAKVDRRPSKFRIRRMSPCRIKFGNAKLLSCAFRVPRAIVFSSGLIQAESHPSNRHAFRTRFMYSPNVFPGLKVPTQRRMAQWSTGKGVTWIKWRNLM